MNRVTGYKCVFASGAQNWKFVLTLAEAPGVSEFAVNDGDATETLLDMFGDATEILFDPATAEVTFHFGYAESEEDEDSDEGDEDDSASASEEGDEDNAKRDAA